MPYLDCIEHIFIREKLDLVRILAGTVRHNLQQARLVTADTSGVVLQFLRVLLLDDGHGLRNALHTTTRRKHNTQHTTHSQ